MNFAILRAYKNSEAPESWRRARTPQWIYKEEKNDKNASTSDHPGIRALCCSSGTALFFFFFYCVALLSRRKNDVGGKCEIQESGPIFFFPFSFCWNLRFLLLSQRATGAASSAPGLGAAWKGASLNLRVNILRVQISQTASITPAGATAKGAALI